MGEPVVVVDGVLIDFVKIQDFMQTDHATRNGIEIQLAPGVRLAIKGCERFIPSPKSLEPRALGIKTKFFLVKFDARRGSIILLDVGIDSEADVGCGQRYSVSGKIFNASWCPTYFRSR